MSQRKPQPRRGQKPADAPETENDRIAGRNPVLEALRSDAKIDLIYVGQESGGLQEIIRLAKEKGIPVKVVTESKLSQLTGGAVHQGVAAEGACAPMFPWKNCWNVPQKRANRRCWYSVTASRTPTIWVRSSGRQRLPAHTAW